MRHYMHPCILRMQNYMEKHYWEDIKADDVAKAAGYSVRHCNVLFHTCCGETLGEYLLSLRMEDAKRMLDMGLPVGRVACSLSYTPRGFLKAFRGYFGVSPSQYVKTGAVKGPYLDRYEWRNEKEGWATGQNPTPDGLWEFSGYDPETKEYFSMIWDKDSEAFHAPGFLDKASPQWYCQNRYEGNGIHPGRGTHAVKTFICPHDGTVKILMSAGRMNVYWRRWIGTWNSYTTPCSAQLYLNGVPLGEAVVMTTEDPAILTAECSVRTGDRLSFHVDSMGNQVADAVVLYRQWVAYRNPLADRDV